MRTKVIKSEFKIIIKENKLNDDDEIQETFKLNTIKNIYKFQCDFVSRSSNFVFDEF